MLLGRDITAKIGINVFSRIRRVVTVMTFDVRDSCIQNKPLSVDMCSVNNVYRFSDSSEDKIVQFWSLKISCFMSIVLNFIDGTGFAWPRCYIWMIN
jgi:hypothetical protein